MKALMKWMWLSLMVVFTSAALAQMEEVEYRETFSQAELDQVLAPIALYPDSLLSQILMAATYPQDIAEAASWSRANSGVRGDAAVRAVENEPWDPSVISLTAFPEVLAMMDERRDWTERLGDAYLAQPEQVMETVQELRARADAAGNLRSSEEIVVQRHGNDYVIEPPTPEVIYVPYYDPRVAYGSWWWDDYPPVYWNPWPGYSYFPGYSGFGWGYGITLGSSFFFGSIDWPRRHLRFSHHRPWYFHGRDFRHGHRWTHDRDHRRDHRDTRWRDRDHRRGDRDHRRWDRDGRQFSGNLNRGSGQHFERRDGGRRDGRTERREWRGTNRSSSSVTPQTAPQGGFFRAPPAAAPVTQGRAERNAVARPVAPVAPTAGARTERGFQPRERVRREQAMSGIARQSETRRFSRPAETRSFSPPRAPQSVGSPQPQRVSPTMRQAAPRAQPSRQQPSRQSSAARPARSAVERSAPSSRQSSGATSPIHRGGRGGRER